MPQKSKNPAAHRAFTAIQSSYLNIPDFCETSRFIQPRIARTQMHPVSKNQHKQETADRYALVVAVLDQKHRVIICSDKVQWILQRSKNSEADRPWRSLGYFPTKAALRRTRALPAKFTKWLELSSNNLSG
jgi:hypothetical protein